MTPCLSFSRSLRNEKNLKTSLSLIFIIFCCILSLEPALGAEVGATSDEHQERLHFIRESLRRDAEHARTWYYTWQGIQGALAAGSFAIAPFMNDSDDRLDFYYGGGTAVAGIVILALNPLTVIQDHRLLEEKMKTSSTDGLPALLTEAERMLERDAANEAFGRNWMAHTGNVLFNVATGLGLGLGFDHWESAAYNTGIGIVIGEILILTQPNRLGEDLKRYRNGDWKEASQEGSLRWNFTPVLGPNLYAVQLGIQF